MAHSQPQQRSSKAPIFPSQFLLQDIVEIISPVFPYASSPHEEQVDVKAREWYRRIGMYDDKKCVRFLDRGNFARFAAMSYPNADEKHLLTCLWFYLWAFSIDDLWDSAPIEEAEASVRVCMKVLQSEKAPRPKEPVGSMLYDIMKQMRATATPGNVRRFARAFERWSSAAIEQNHRRNRYIMPTVEEFIIARRLTIGQEAVEAFIEYSLDLKLPDYVFNHPVMIGISEATNDILTWPNDLCSFNKEQADGDYQNFVCILMAERRLDLQDAIDTLTNMIAARVEDYVQLKKKLPSFGRSVDDQLAIYLANLEHEVHASVQWYYDSPRYWKSPVTCRKNMRIDLFPRK